MFRTIFLCFFACALLFGCSSPIRTLEDSGFVDEAMGAAEETSPPLDAARIVEEDSREAGAAAETSSLLDAAPPEKPSSEYDRAYCIRRITGCGSPVSTEGCLVMLGADPEKTAFRCSESEWRFCLASVGTALCSSFSPAPWQYLWTRECEVCR